MCGICGYVHHDMERPIVPFHIHQMTATLTHRGPDSDGFHIQHGVALGMRRLSIIDVQGGDQPIYNEDGSLVIVFNGEIYNFHELRRTLSADGHRFKTNTDTEAILHAYEKWGLDCLEYINGMFAFAIWDNSQQALFLARDRTGIKPLYYALHDDSLLFASELKAFLKYPNFPRILNYRALDKYLTFEYIPAPDSIFQAAHKLPPGHALRYCRGEIKVWQYWDLRLEKSEGVEAKPIPELAAELRAVLKDVVQHEMISDVPLGVLLSGGVDSSSIAALMTEISPQRVKSFSISFEDVSFDESRFARQVADHVGTEHHELCLTGSKVLELLPRVGQYMDEPLADSSFVPTMLLAGFAREQVTVALGGDGGDEIFGGYSTLQAHRLMTLYQNTVPSPFRRLAGSVVKHLPVSFNNISLDFKLKRFVSGDQLPFEVRHQYWLGSFDHTSKKGILARDLLREQDATFENVQNHTRRCKAAHLINRVLYLDMKMYLDGDILPKVDRASMSHSLEVRVPFLNYDILKFAESLPVDYKLRNLTTKAILREAMRDDLPPEILARSKKGFNIPIARWLTEDLRDWAHDLLAYPRLKQQGIFDAGGVQRLLQAHMNRRQDARKHLWTLLTFQMWFDTWYANNT